MLCFRSLSWLLFPNTGPAWWLKVESVHHHYAQKENKSSVSKPLMEEPAGINFLPYIRTNCKDEWEAGSVVYQLSQKEGRDDSALGDLKRGNRSSQYSPLSLWVLCLWIQPMAQQKYLKKITSLVSIAVFSCHCFSKRAV